MVRPIVSGCSGPTENLSAFLDYYLQPLMKLIPSYIRDSKQMASYLDSATFPSNCLLVTIDVVGLYLNIPHKEGVASALRHLYDLNPDADDLPFPRATARTLLETVLTNNYFIFNSEVFHQVRGTAMGTKMAPAYANLFMHNLEEALLAGEPVQPAMWRRYIDDIFAVWTGSRQALDEFISRLNSHHHSIKFTHTISSRSVVFLDLEIHKGTRFGECGRLDLRPHFKHTNCFQYLQFSSAHPRATFRGIVKGELIRILRASSNRDTFQKATKLLINKFRARGYPRDLLQRVSAQVPFTMRPASRNNLSATVPPSSALTLTKSPKQN